MRKIDVYKNFLHVFPANCAARNARMAFPKGSHFAYTDNDFATGCLPQDLTTEEFQRCKDNEYVNYTSQYNLFGSDLSAYEGIIIWHSTDVNSMLIFAIMCAFYKGALYHCNVSEHFVDVFVES